ncbi:MAG: pyridoxamine 5'-phosphate oxidase family protein [Fusobacterium sp.]|nr:pyridoxamine 5'-phosphate oxidase family protein [Fusobacterium sp.]
MNKKMEMILEFFGDAHTPVAVSTVSKDMPKVRFMSFKMLEGDKLYFMTAKSKNTYKELVENNNIEICSLPSEKKEWVRANGKVEFVRDIELNKKAFEILPLLEKAYQNPENEEIALFYIDEIKATKYSMGAPAEEL